MKEENKIFINEKFIDEWEKKLDDSEYIDNYTLMYIINHSHQERLRNRAALKIFEQNPTNNQLCEVIRWISSDEIREMAAKKLLKEDQLTNPELCIIIEWVNNAKIKDMAVERLFEQKPNNNQLRLVIVSDKKFAQRAGNLMFKNYQKDFYPDENDLFFLINWVDSLRLIAANELLRHNLSSKSKIRLLMKEVPELNDKLWPIYLKNKPTKAELEWVVENIESLRLKAEEVLKNN